MSILRLPSTTLEYVYLPVKATNSAGASVDIDALTVEAAFVAGLDDPAEDDWVAATWEAGGPDSAGYYQARVLIGTGGDVELAEGAWQAWVRVTDSPEVPVRHVGQLNVT